jgi:hypothetical protein
LKNLMHSKKVKQPISVTHPEISRLARGWDPKTVTAGGGKKLEWQCLKGHIFVTSALNLVKYFSRSDSKGCPVCANKIVLKGFNDLTTTHPEIAGEAFGWDPTTVTCGTQRKLNWMCSDGHIFSQSPNYRTRVDKRPRKNKNSVNSKNGSTVKNCPVCKGSKVLHGVNDLETKFPDLAKQAYGWDPSLVTPGSGRILEWKCKLGHIFKSSVWHRTEMQAGCPYCSNRKVMPGFNDLATTNPDIASEAYGWDPSTTTSGSGKKYDWKCKLGHIYSTTAVLRLRYWPGGCPVCANKIVLKGFNDLATTHPDIAREAYGWDPTTVTRGNTKKLKWVCSKGHIFLNYCNARTNLGRSCPMCANQEVLAGYNDLMTTHPDIASRAYGWDPSKVFAGTLKKYQWKCEKGHIWRTDVNSQKISGCPTCANRGFDPNDKGYLYFIEHSDWQMFQIGISNNPERRLNEHQKLGWKVIENRGPMDGHLTQQWETGILRMLKASGADLSNEKIAGKFDGYSEAWSKSTFPVKSIKELMKLTEEYEEKKRLSKNP